MQDTNTNDASGTSDASTENQTPSENVWDTETRINTVNTSENKQNGLVNNENITVQASVEDSLYSINVSEASEASGTDKNQNTDSNWVNSALC